jgi:hypothetical protein
MRLQRGIMVTLVAFGFACGGEAYEEQPDAAVEAVAANENPRFGQWKMQSDAPPPSINIMTYEPYESNGMQITVASTNAEGNDNEWGYVTMFDGEFQAVTGQEGSETAVEIVDDKINKITNKRNGVVTQVIMNVLSDDGNTIDNEYQRMDADGNITRTSYAVYERIH